MSIRAYPGQPFSSLLTGAVDWPRQTLRSVKQEGEMDHIETLEARAAELTEEHNALLNQERELDVQRAQVHEQRVRLIGGIQEMSRMISLLRGGDVEASVNGSGDLNGVTLPAEAAEES